MTPIARITNSLGLRRATLAFFMRHAPLADFFEVPIVGDRTMYFVSSASGIRRVLVDNVDGYARATNLEVPLFVDAVGRGLLSTDGDTWKRLRRIQARPFTRARVAELERSVVDHVETILTTWRAWRPTETYVDLFPRLVALNAAVSVKAMFDFTMEEDDALALARALMVGQDHVFSEMLAAVRTPLWVPTPLNRRYRHALSIVEGVFRRILAARIAAPEVARDDLLASLLGYRHPTTGAPLDDPELRDQVVTAFVAAPENMATALVWSLRELGERSELVPQVAEGGAEGSSYRAKFFREILRLYPGAPVITRRVLEADVIDGHRVEGGSYVVISPYVLHRNPRFWSNPTTFDVERREYDALEGREERVHYIPFGLGARKCIGDHFARLVLDIVLRTLVERLEIVPDPSRRAVPRPRVNLRPADGLWMRLRARPARAA